VKKLNDESTQKVIEKLGKANFTNFLLENLFFYEKLSKGK